MTRRFRFLLILVFGWICGLFADGPSGRMQWAWAQDSSRSSQPEGENRDERRDRYRGRSGSDRGRDYRGSRSRSEEERRSDEQSRSTGSGTTNSSGPSSSSRSMTPATSATSTPAAKPTTDSAAPSLNMKDYATRLVTKYDKNGNMMLEPDEQKELRGPAAESDLNHDGHITIDELVLHLSAPQGSPPASTAGSSGSSTTSSGSSSDRERSFGFRHRDSDSTDSDRSKSDAGKALAGRVFTGSAGGSGSTTKEGDKRKSYRFGAASDRRPGLPVELKSRDTNGDGQVSMSEFSRSWSASAVADFRRWDLNNDGIITAQEAAKKK